MISFGSLNYPTEAAELCRASAREFGAVAYQQLPRYLDWLYRRNPVSRGARDCLVARQDGAIVGCMHRMMLPLESDGGESTLAVLHNHFVADAVRSGPGVLLLRRATKGVDIVFAPGVQAPLDGVYRQLGFREHRGFWLMRPLARVRAALQLASARLRASDSLKVDLERVRRRCRDVVVTVTPDDVSVARLCERMRAAPSLHARVAWTPALVRWRYFDPLGPRHLLVIARETGDMAVIALGRRHGVAVARLLEWTGADRAWLTRVSAVMRAAGAVLALSFTTDATAAAQLAHQGWRRRDNGTFSFRTAGPELYLGAGATDVGFEAFTTEFA